MTKQFIEVSTMAVKGIENYEPVQLIDSKSIIKIYRETKTNFCDQQFSENWTAWSDDKNEWWEHAPIILKFGTFCHEVCWMQEYDLLISADTINTSNNFNLYDLDEYPSHWRKDALSSLQSSIGRNLLGIDLLEAEVNYTPGSTSHLWIPYGIIFMFNATAFCIYNAFDSNGTTTIIPTGDEYRRINIW